MERIYVFLIRNDIWIFILCALGLIWYFSELWRSRRLLRSAMFGLEKERGQQLQRRAIVFIAIFAGLAGIVAYVNTSIAPTLPADLLKPPTPTPNIFATPLSSPTPDNESLATATLGIAPTVTLAESGNGPPVVENPEALENSLEDTPTPADELDSCNQDINISAPTNGSIVTGEFSVFGTANIRELDAYTLEANGPQTGGTWLPILSDDGRNLVFEGILGEVNMSNWLPGPYLIRLSVFDGDGVPTGQCSVDVQLQPATS